MTNTKRFPRTELTDAVAPIRRRHRQLIDAAVAWQAAVAAESGAGRAGPRRQTDPDHFALICAGAEYAAEWATDPVDQDPFRWTRVSVYHLVRCDIPNWCSGQRCLWPEQLPEALWEWFDFLHATGRLHPSSDPVTELHKPLACYGWLDQDGRKLPPDAAPQIACECMLPYRETAELLGELGRQWERCGRDPLDSLRLLVGRPTRTPWTASGPASGPAPGEADIGDAGPVDLDELWRWNESGGDR
jgi:hypothetical protein